MQEKEKHHFESQRSTRRLQEVHQAVQEATGKFLMQERATKKAVADATEKSPRINTTRLILRNDIHDRNYHSLSLKKICFS